MEWALLGKPTAVGLATGAVAGLVGVTPAAGFVTPVGSLLIGGIVAFCCFYAIRIKNKLGIDDALDTYPVHGVGGTIGASSKTVSFRLHYLCDRRRGDFPVNFVARQINRDSGCA
jgi:ammonia channel protein AmtB